jgi:HEAT repeat protein
VNGLLRKLSSGSLVSDGKADRVADAVIANPRLTKLLVDGLFEPDDLIRGRTAHAVERVSRAHPERIVRLLPQLIHLALHDRVPMVRWHMAMVFGNLNYPKGKADLAVATLLKMLKDESVFVRSWALTSLAVLGRKYKNNRAKILRNARACAGDKSISVRTKLGKLIKILQNEDEPIPAGWIKAEGK